MRVVYLIITGVQLETTSGTTGEALYIYIYAHNNRGENPSSLEVSDGGCRGYRGF